DLSKGSDQMWDYWMFNFASGGHLLDQEGEPTYPDKDKVPLAILEWWVAAANDWKIVNAQADFEVPTAGALTPLRTQGSQPGYGGGGGAARPPPAPRGGKTPRRGEGGPPGESNTKIVLFPRGEARPPRTLT